ncbi:hypothetical protein [Actinopolymorpha alba]|uniref:hypothetical protein n=1 Tax=Actinopolymorpha alba TaxID=533267 RepID=UPI00037EF199|nr:hypothetical protein [Actinopolymorpha alba]
MALSYVGVAVADITPVEPVPLAGFAVRLDPWEKVLAPLAAQVFAFGGPPLAAEAAGRPVPVTAVLVCADLLWWGPDVVASLTGEIAREYGVPAESVVLHASHTHSAPQPGLTFSPLIGPGDDAYVARLQAAVLDAVGRALEDLEPVTFTRGTGECRTGISRRRVNADGTVGGPDPGGPADHEVGVIRMARADGRPKAVLVHHACHPVISADPQVTPDYPGAMRADLEASLGDGVVVGFLQGCCGDINPALVRDGGFGNGGDAEIAAFGGALAAAVRQVLDRPMTELGGGEGAAAASVRTEAVNLPLRRPEAAELEALREESGIWGEWARWLLAEPARLVDQVPLRLTRLDLADGLALLGFDAEVTVAYGHYVKERSASRVLPLGYTNGMIGYVVTAEQLRAGGYEPDQSYPYVYRAGRFAPEVEERVKAAIDQALDLS